MLNQTIKSVKEYVERTGFDPCHVEVYSFCESAYSTLADIHTDKIASVPYDFDSEIIPDNIPVLQMVDMDEDEYSNTIEANCAHVPFSDYLEGDDPHILVVVLPYDWEEYAGYYTVSASTGEVDDAEFNDMGGFCSWNENAEPLFSVIDRIGKDSVQPYSSEEEAMAEVAKLKKYYQEHIGFNEQVSLCTIHHYLEDGVWLQDDPENYEDVVYQFKDITGAVIVVWAWETHVGYARKFKEIRTVSEFDACHDESLLESIDHPYRSQCSILFTNEEAKKAISNGTFGDELEEKLLEKGWKWTNPDFIRQTLNADKELR